jgi:putative membrane protein
MVEHSNPSTEELARQRTVMAAERTFMAWVRTSIALISFGFTIDKLLEYTRDATGNVMKSAEGPRNLGTALVAAGVVFLFFSSVQHWRLLRKVEPRMRIHAGRLSLFLAGFLVVVGLLALVNIIFHKGPF